MIYTIATQKGGTGKTTTAAALAQAAAYKGKSCLAIDLDPQANLTYCLAADETQPGSYDLLHGAAASQVTQTTAQSIDVISASPDLQTETSSRGSARRLQKALALLKDQYDVIIIDTPATAGELQYNALQAADRLIIPLEADAYNLQSLAQITDAAAQISDSNPDLQIAGVLLTQYDPRPVINRQLREMLQENAAAQGIPFLGTVRKAVAVKEAAALQVSLFDYAPKCKPAADYMNIYEQLEKQEG